MKTYHNTKDIIRYIATGVTNGVGWRVGEYNRGLKFKFFNFFSFFQPSFSSTWETERASLAVWTEVWERSTIMPSLFISCTTVCNGTFVSLLYPAYWVYSGRSWTEPSLDIWFILPFQSPWVHYVEEQHQVCQHWSNQPLKGHNVRTRTGDWADRAAEKVLYFFPREKVKNIS